MKTTEELFKEYVNNVCKYCSKKENCIEDLRIRLNQSVRCYEYKRNKKDNNKKHYSCFITAKRYKPLMKGIDS